MKITMLSRSYCHLCDVMQEAFLAWQALPENASRIPKIGHLQMVDVDEFAELEALWGDKVPVLLLNNLEVCHYHFDGDKLAAMLKN